MNQHGPTPPHSIEAEESVCGGILVHSRKLVDVVPLLKADDFYHPALRAIYEAMLELDRASKPVDVLTVVEQMRAMDTFEKLNAFKGAEYLHDLMAKVVSVENLAYHAKLIASKASKRRRIDAYRELAAAGYDDGDDDAYFAQGDAVALQLAMTRTSSAPRPVAYSKLMREWTDDLHRRAELRARHGVSITGIPTGYSEIDEMLSGLQPTDLVIVAGRPSMGKSTWAMNSVVNAARIRGEGRKHKHPALVFSLEMGKEQLAEKTVAGEARINSRNLRQGEVTTSQWEKIYRATSNLGDMPIEVLDRGTISVAEMFAEARVWLMRLKQSGKFVEGDDFKPIVVVDYLQLVSPEVKPKRQSNRTEDVSGISRDLKKMAKELRVPVVALSQLNRSLESRADKRPMMSDLRESGAIEQDADVIAFIYREEKYWSFAKGPSPQCDQCAEGVAEFIVGKQRMGPCGTVHLTFYDSIQRFENMSPR